MSLTEVQGKRRSMARACSIFTQSHNLPRHQSRLFQRSPDGYNRRTTWSAVSNVGKGRSALFVELRRWDAVNLKRPDVDVFSKSHVVSVCCANVDALECNCCRTATLIYIL